MLVPIFALPVCPIVTLHVSFVNSEATVQRSYIKIGVLNIWKIFKKKFMVK